MKKQIFVIITFLITLLVLYYFLSRTGLWLGLSIILIYLILVFLRFWLSSKENNKISRLEELTDGEIKSSVKSYFEKDNWQLIKENENDLVFKREEEKMIVRGKLSLRPINRNQLKEFKYLLSHGNYTKAYFIAKSDFNKNCLAEKNGIELINGRRLLKMIDKKILMQSKENYGR